MDQSTCQKSRTPFPKTVNARKNRSPKTETKNKSYQRAMPGASTPSKALTAVDLPGAGKPWLELKVHVPL